VGGGMCGKKGKESEKGAKRVEERA